MSKSRPDVGYVYVPAATHTHDAELPVAVAAFSVASVDTYKQSPLKERSETMEESGEGERG